MSIRLRFKDYFYSAIYRLLRSEATNNFSSCGKCKKRCRNFSGSLFKENSLIGYDRILGEWVVFTEYNTYAKIWVLNGHTVKILTLHEKLWKDIRPLCRKCISDYLVNYKEPENEAG